jgi:hypothetical protein
MGDHPIHTPRVRALFSRIARDEERVATTDTVSFEAVSTLEKLYRVARAEIRDSLVPLLELPDIVLPGKRRYRRIFALWVGQRRLSFADCYRSHPPGAVTSSTMAPPCGDAIGTALRGRLGGWAPRGVAQPQEPATCRVATFRRLKTLVVAIQRTSVASACSS